MDNIYIYKTSKTNIIRGYSASKIVLWAIRSIRAPKGEYGERRHESLKRCERIGRVCQAPTVCRFLVDVKSRVRTESVG